MNTHLNLGITAETAKLIITDKLAVFQGQQMDEVTYREMTLHLNHSVHPAIGTDFYVVAFSHADGIGVNVSFFTGGGRMTIGVFPEDIRERNEAIYAELDLLIEAAAQMSKDAVDSSRRHVSGAHNRWLSIANTHFQEGFAALRRAHSKVDPDAY